MKRITNNGMKAILTVATVAVTFGLSACGANARETKGKETGVPKANESSMSNEQAASSSEATSGDEVTSGSIENQSNEIVPTESTEEQPMKEVKIVIDAKTFIDFINDASTTYPVIPQNEMIAFTLSVNYDYISAEDIETIMNTYGVFYDDLSNDFNECCRHIGTTCTQTYNIISGSSVKVEDTYNYQFWPSQSVFILNEEEKDFANAYDVRIEKFANGQGNNKAKEYSGEKTFLEMNSLEMSFFVLDYKLLYGNHFEIQNLFDLKK